MILSCLTFLLALTLTGLMRYLALHKNLLDVPNARSSHSTPTPRGGGIAIVAAYLAALTFLFATGELPLWTWLGLAASAGAVALIGFIDDLEHVPARWRLLVHGGAAAWLLACVGGLPALDVPLLGTLDAGWLGTALLWVFLIWLINLYNFMDGIDGIAAAQAVTVCLGMAFLSWYAGHGEIGLPLGLLAMAALGFLVWNFPPAKIFMGDVGSGFLGVALGGLMTWQAQMANELIWAWLIMLGSFVVDASLTLLCRLLRGKRVYEAHRSHAYQSASQLAGAHRPVTLAVIALNLFWLLPCAWLAIAGVLPGLVALVIAYVPLLLLALHFRAGFDELEMSSARRS
ncbi:glycosyltransferase family 4 protein [Pseudomonas sp. RIT-PI-AD]|uniref:MraY family glycosyltransferase n=1 Tax=Pseudomonas sp. RIT-PI-AD TaxID=3035294 RepID=UPI0021D930D4|nr:glycosyltransferase family 4 protein [Pseudomonas sp. RIT-PI-AD]